MTASINKLNSGLKDNINPNNESALYLLASYPKSGNTWVRAFLTALLQLQPLEPPQTRKDNGASNSSIDVNNLIGFGFTERAVMEQNHGIDTADLSIQEIMHLQYAALRQYKKKLSLDKKGGVFFMKDHNAYESAFQRDLSVRDLSNQRATVFSPDIFNGVIYIVRNPLDVVASYANHTGGTLDAAIRDLGSTTDLRDNAITKRYTGDWLSSWSGHVSSWCLNDDLPPPMKPLIVRYEDMLQHSQLIFEQITRFAGLAHEEAAILAAIDQASFGKLKKNEQQTGFLEKQISSEGFFRKGKSGDWQETLTTQQVQTIISDHGEVMHYLGYLDQDNKPTELIC